jgi:hypothetical protein
MAVLQKKYFDAQKPTVEHRQAEGITGRGVIPDDCKNAACVKAI